MSYCECGKEIEVHQTKIINTVLITCKDISCNESTAYYIKEVEN